MTTGARIAYRSGEVAALCGFSKSTWYSYLARGLCPPCIPSPTGHATLFLKSTVEDWLRRSEAAGRLLNRAEYLALVEEDVAREAAGAAGRQRTVYGEGGGR
jgi:predicted DNA-binding transcriptional regulator AlpA